MENAPCLWALSLNENILEYESVMHNYASIPHREKISDYFYFLSLPIFQDTCLLKMEVES